MKRPGPSCRPHQSIHLVLGSWSIAAIFAVVAFVAPSGASLRPGTVLPPFVHSETLVTKSTVRYTWRPGCPVGPASLRLLRLSYFGFDHKTHLGTIIVNEAVVTDVVTVFSKLYEERFPIRSMTPEDTFEGSDPRSMAADNTSGFNCRYAVAPGTPTWSVHAYGEAIDVNPVENPYIEGSTVMPTKGEAFVNRSDMRPGMAEPNGELVNAFKSVSWYWGGRWTGSPDYQHFSLNGK